jgi:hypothetical protein
MLTIVIAGCNTTYYRYDFRLDDHVPENDMTFEDDIILVEVEMTKTGIKMGIINKTEDMLRLIWDKTAYIVDGKSFYMINGDTRVIDSEKSQKPTTIPPRTQVEVFMVPESIAGPKGLKGVLLPSRPGFKKGDRQVASLIEHGRQVFTVFEHADEELTYTFKIYADSIRSGGKLVTLESLKN